MIIQGNSLNIPLADNSVHCVVTSPPYWALRDYGVDGQLGLESTPDEYIANMVQVFREVRRVLRDDGTLWLNIGDSYATGYKGVIKSKEGDKNYTNKGTVGLPAMRMDHGVKDKDLVGIPWMLAFALRADGWYLRQDIIWNKPNPMPESVGDRCTKAHEYLFLLTKSPRYFYDQDAILEPVSMNTHARMAQNIQDQIGSARANGGTREDRPMKAVGRRGVQPGNNPDGGVINKNMPNGWHNAHNYHGANPAKPRLPGNKTHRGTAAYEAGDEHHRTKAELVEYSRKLADAASGIKNNDSMDAALAVMPSMRNKRSVWTITTKGYKEAHFATYPPELVEPCILAGTSAYGCCAECGTPYERVVKKPEAPHDGETETAYSEKSTAGRLAKLRQAARERGEEYGNKRETMGWRKTCNCSTDERVPCTVLDPFNGSATTGEVAIENGRRYVGIEINPEYIAMSLRRLARVQPQLLGLAL